MKVRYTDNFYNSNVRNVEIDDLSLLPKPGDVLGTDPDGSRYVVENVVCTVVVKKKDPPPPPTVEDVISQHIRKIARE